MPPLSGWQKSRVVARPNCHIGSPGSLACIAPAGNLSQYFKTV